MKRRKFTGAALICMLFAPAMAIADNSVLSDLFQGSENRMPPASGTCLEPLDQLAYQDAGTFVVSETGSYFVRDINQYNGVDIVARIYGGSFDPGSPETNLLTTEGIDEAESVDLMSGVEYRLVVQQWCKNVEGAWAVTFTGPGSLSSDLLRTVPAMTSGIFSGDDPVVTTACSTNGQYHVEGPIQVATTGTYYYTDVLWDVSFDVCLQVYTQPFDPNNPDANIVEANFGHSFLDDANTIDLQAAQDYYFVTQPRFSANTGTYFYMLVPPAPFRINKALAGGWYNPETLGQGFFVDIYENSNRMFVGWYTFDLTRPVDGTAQLGEPGHRWLTALGAIEGHEGTLDVYLAQGGAFDSVSPPIETPQTVVGSMTFDFDGCSMATVDYTLTQPVASGSIPVQPLAGDHVELCESMTEQPGIPGPL